MNDSEANRVFKASMESATEDNLRLVGKWFQEVWNEGREETIDEMLDAETIVHGLTSGTIGFGEFKQFWSSMNRMFANLKVDVQEVIGSNDLTAGRYVVTARHTGGGLGVPPTNRLVSFGGQTIAKWRDGRIVEGWNTIDMASVYQQVGALIV